MQFRAGRDDDEEHKDEMDQLHMKRRRERIEKETEQIHQLIAEQNYTRMVDKFQKTFDNHIKELL